MNFETNGNVTYLIIFIKILFPCHSLQKEKKDSLKDKRENKRF